MKQIKSNLDEMQEQELLRIEHNGCWIAFWGLLAAIAVQSITAKDLDPRTIAGEWIVFMVLSVYLAIACGRKGIWDRRLPMNTKTNLIVSAVTGLAFGLFMAVMTYKIYNKPAGTLAASLISAVIVFILCFAALTITMKETKKKQKQLEEEPADADEM